MLQGLGQEKGLAFMRALAKQQPQLRNGRTLLAQLVAAGEVNSALAGYSQNFENLKRDGAPADWVPLGPGLRQFESDGTFGAGAASQRGQAVHQGLRLVEGGAGSHPRPAARARPDRRAARPAQTSPGILRGVHSGGSLRELRSVREAVPRYVREQVASNWSVLFSQISPNEFNRMV